MAVRTAINGFGRMGRLALRAAWGSDELDFVHLNEIAGDAECAAHLLKFDSVHGRWEREACGGRSNAKQECLERPGPHANGNGSARVAPQLTPNQYGQQREPHLKYAGLDPEV